MPFATNDVYRILEVEHREGVAELFRAVSDGQAIRDQEPQALQQITETLSELVEAQVLAKREIQLLNRIHQHLLGTEIG